MLSGEVNTGLRKTFLNLERVRLHLGLSHKIWAALQEFTPAEYEQLYLNRSDRYPFKSLLKVSAELGLTPEHFFGDSFLDLSALKKHLTGNSEYVPERYMIGAFSRRRTMKNIFDYIENRLGVHNRYYTMRLLQVTPQALDMVDASINLQLAVDTMNILDRNGVDRNFFRELGSHSVKQTLTLPFAKEMAACRSIPEVYQCYIEDKVRFIEKNAIYKFIGINDLSFIAEASPSDEVVEALKNKRYGSPLICEFKNGLVTHIASYGGFAAVNASKIKCIHFGNSSCQWLIQYDKKTAKQRLKPNHIRVVQ